MVKSADPHFPMEVGGGAGYGVSSATGRAVPAVVGVDLFCTTWYSGYQKGQCPAPLVYNLEVWGVRDGLYRLNRAGDMRPPSYSRAFLQETHRYGDTR